MGTANRASVAALLALAVALGPARAQEAVRTPRSGADLAQRACLNQKERRTLVENGTVLRLAAAMHAVRSRVPGTLVRARLCRRPEGLVYVLTVLAHDGKVVRVVVDAAKGTPVGGL
jgi:uncharacterized membrane protein YkoI